MTANRTSLRWEVSLDRDLKACSSPSQPQRADGAFEVAHRTVDHRTVLFVRGELDGTNAPELGRAAHRALASKPHQLVIDLCKVAFIDYRGLSVLLNARRRARHLGIDLSLACDVPSTLLLLKHTRLDRDFDLHATSADALRGPRTTRA